MEGFSAVLIAVVVVALVFDYTNGFHDAANAIATSIGTRALRPGVALGMAATLNIVGGLVFPTKVADTMTQIVDRGVASQELVLAALIGAIIWNLLTWWYGIPSSSSHALIGGLVGGSAGATFGLDHVQWSNVVQKVILPTVASPLIGLVAASIVTTIFYRFVNGGTSNAERVIVRTLAVAALGGFLGFVLHLVVAMPLEAFTGWEAPWWLLAGIGSVISWPVLRGTIGKGPAEVNRRFRFLQGLSAAFMALEHGHNDAQKTMGIITLALISAGNVAPGGGVPLWVKLSCAVVIGLGTFSGGKRIIKTMGMKLVKLEPIDGFCAETVAATVIQAAGRFGMPISTTHAITAAIMGVGATKRVSAVKWGVTVNILFAWLVTLPAAGVLAALAYGAIQVLKG